MSSALEGKTIFVTGATAGIGRLAVEALADAGAIVHVHGRDAAKVDAVVDALAARSPETRGFVADLASLRAVAELAERVRRELPVIDVLVNNAGVGFGSDRRRRETSHDGHELRFAVNYLAPVLLTESLLAASRIGRAVVNVSSIGQEALDFADLMCTDYEGTKAYRRSKLALILWTMDLAESHPALRVHALHPGTLLDTNMVRDSGIAPRGPARRGAEVILGVSQRALERPESGLYFDELTEARPKPQAYDRAARAELRRLTLELLEPYLSPAHAQR